MASTESRGSTGLGNTTENLKDGTSALARSPQPGSTGMGAAIASAWSDVLSAPDRLLSALEGIADGASLQKFAVAVLGPQCFAAGVVVGAGADVIGSALDLLKLVKTFVLADLHDLNSAKFSAWSLTNPLGATRLMLAKAAGAVLAEQMRIAAAERDALIKEIGEAINDPGSFFGNVASSVAEGLKKDWNDFNTAMNAGTLEGRYQAGKIFGKLLIQVIALVGGLVAVAKTTVAVAARLPRLAKLVERLGPRAATLKPGAQTGGGAGASSAASEAATGAETTSGPKVARRKAPEQPPPERPAPEVRKVPPGHTQPTGPKGGKPEGTPKKILAQDDPATQRSLMRENESANKLADAGYRVKQQDLKTQKHADYLIEGQPFDCKAPTTPRARNVARVMEDAIGDGQAERFVLNLEDSPITLGQMKKQLTDYPVPGLKEVIVIKGGQVVPFWP